MTNAMYASRRARSRRRALRLTISLIVALLVLGGLGAATLMMFPQLGDRVAIAMGWKTIDFEGEGHGNTSIAIIPGEIGSDVAASLEEAGVVKTADAFVELLLTQEPAVEFMPGTYNLRLEMSSQAALTALQDPANRVELRAVLREGLTVAQSLELLSAGAQVPLDELELAAQNPQQFGLPDGITSLEGWLYPATYEFEAGESAESVLSQVVGYQVQKLNEFGVPEEDRERVLTWASIIEKEAGRAEDFGKVSRVIANRLEQGMALGMDSTAQFGYGQEHDGSVWTSNEALADPNPWNTYVHKGLPIGPIASPGAAAIAAALNPEPGPWLYFVAVNQATGESAFSETLAEHEQNTQIFRDWCAANPEQGC